MLRRGTHLVAVPDTLPDAAVAPANCALATMVAVMESLPHGTGRMAVIQGAASWDCTAARCCARPDARRCSWWIANRNG